MATDIIARGMASKSNIDVETHTNNNDIHVTASDKSNWDSKLDKNQGSENSGKVLGTNANGEVIPLNGYGFEYDEETKMLKYGTDPTSNLNQGIGLDDTLSKTGYAADAGAVGELKEDCATCISPLLVNKQFNWVENQGGGTVQISSIGHMDKNNNGFMNFFIFGQGASKTFTDGHVICSDLPIEIKKFSGSIGGILQPIALFNTSTLLGFAFVTYSNYTKELIIRIDNGGSIDNVSKIQGEFTVPASLISET